MLEDKRIVDLTKRICAEKGIAFESEHAEIAEAIIMGNLGSEIRSTGIDLDARAAEIRAELDKIRGGSDLPPLHERLRF